MIRQLALCIGILIVAAALCVLFVPGTTQTLASFGIPLPASAATPAAASAPQGGQGAAAARQGGQPAAGAQAGQGAATQGGAPGAAAAGGQGAGRGGFGGRAARQSSVVTSDVVMATINDTLSAIGQGNAASSVSIVAPAGGQLTDLLVAPGDIIKAGDVIGRLDSSAEQVAADKAKLALADAEATLKRSQGLANSDLVAGSALATTQLAYDNAKLELQTAELALQKRTITSPIGGKVGLMQVTPGNYVTAQTVVTTIEDASSILIDFWVPERYAASITVGMPVTADAAALPGQTFAGTISAVDNRIDAESRTLKVQARIANDQGVVRPGMSFTMGLKFPGEQFPAVNPLAVQWSSDGSFVWTEVGGKAHKVMAEIIQRNSNGVLVKGELKPGDAVISEGVLQLNEGTAVTVLDGPGKQAANAAPAGQPTDVTKPLAAPGAAPAATPATGAPPAAGAAPAAGTETHRKRDGQGTSQAAPATDG